MRHGFLCLAGLLGAALAACAYPEGFGDPRNADPEGDAPSPAVSDPEAPPPSDPGPAALRRLTTFQLANAAEDLLGPEARAFVVDFPEENADTFDTIAESQSFSQGHASAWMATAEKLAGLAVTKLGTLAPCDLVARGEKGCAEVAIDHLGKRIFRRPLTLDERTRFLALYDAARTAKVAHPDAVGWALEAMFQAPQFVYLRERGTAAGDLDAFEIASRLSFFFQQSTPDDALLAAAERGDLLDKTKLATEIERLVAAPRAHAAVAHFHEQWLGFTKVTRTSKDDAVAPDFDEVRGAMAEEARTFVDKTFWEVGTLGTFFAAPYTYVNAPLATFYGFPAPAGTGFEKVAVDPSQRAGLLTQGFFLAGEAHRKETSTTLRGKYVMTRLLCRAPAAPPQAQDLGALGGATTGRARGEMLVAEGTCSASCHRGIDPVGFAFEHFDPAGRWRTAEPDGAAVNAAGEIPLATPVKVEGATDLAKKLAASEEAKRCLTSQWFSFAAGRALAPAADDPTITWLADRARTEGDLDVRVVWKRMAETAPFRRRGGGVR